MRHRYLSQARMLGLAELLVLPFEDVHRRRPVQPIVRPVDLCQQRHIAAGVPGGKPSTAIRHGLDGAVAVILTDEPRHLWQAQARDLAETGAHRSALLLGFARVLLRHQHLLNERIAIGSALPGELDCKTAPEES